MAQNLSAWAELAGSIGLTVCTSLKTWVGHVDKRDVLARTLEKTDSAHKAKVLEAWASIERSSLADLLHKIKK